MGKAHCLQGVQAMTGMPAIELPLILTGLRFGIDEVSRAFLFFTALLWLISGVYSHYYMQNDPARRLFFLFFLFAMAGNIGVVLALDMVGFYLSFAVMTFASYPLIAHEKTQEFRYAGKVYIVMALIGETMLISAMMLIAPEAESASFSDIRGAVVASGNRDIFTGLVLSGFGVKTGAVLLHMWLPLAYPAAPVPAAAVLSGAMIKAGFLGWIRFLPLGEIAFPGWGTLCIFVGFAAAFYGVAVGLMQDDPKTVLAYSSISQMGIMTTGVGFILSFPELRPAGISALIVYSLHHALNKGALFLGTGLAMGAGSLRERRLAGLGLFLPSLALAGAPFTSGAVAKVALKEIAGPLYGFGSDMTGWLFPLTSAATAVLMGRFLLLIRTSRNKGETSGSLTGSWLSWLSLLACIAAAGFFLPFNGSPAVRNALSIENIFSALWPVLGGAALFWGVLWLMRKSGMKFTFRIPPGDLLMPVVRTLEHMRHAWYEVAPYSEQLPRTAGKLFQTLSRTSCISSALKAAESGLAQWTVAGAVYIALALLLFVLLFL
jgi:formate hydrogenlyase subunit 3/multisubunit Na+/H+ antiporter MnhD subunit